MRGFLFSILRFEVEHTRDEETSSTKMAFQMHVLHSIVGKRSRHSNGGRYLEMDRAEEANMIP